MALNCGIVGLPNVGKSTLFAALTSNNVEAENYPFCTIEPNMGIVNVPDKRMEQICEYITPQKKIPAITEFVDIAGLVKGASKGEGLGNQFLGHIRQVGAIIHVVRCFENDDIIHVNGKISPLDDIEVINTELALADLEAITKKQANLSKQLKSQDKKVSQEAKMLAPLLEQLQEALEAGKMARSLDFSDDDKLLVDQLQLITMKKHLYLCNVDEETLNQDNEHTKQVYEYAAKENSMAIKVCGQIEAEIAGLESEEERREFLADLG